MAKHSRYVVDYHRYIVGVACNLPDVVDECLT